MALWAADGHGPINIHYHSFGKSFGVKVKLSKFSIVFQGISLLYKIINQLYERVRRHK